MSDTSRRSQAPASWPSPSPIAIAIAKDSPLEASTAAVALVLAYVVALSIEFEAGAGYTVPTVLVLVPMLYLLPPAPVPLCVVAAHLVSYVVKVLLGHAAHLWAVFGQGWHSLGPALVLSLASPGHASWDDLPLLGAAFVGDVVFDAAASHPNDEPRPSDRQPAAEASERHGASD